MQFGLWFMFQFMNMYFFTALESLNLIISKIPYSFFTICSIQSVIRNAPLTAYNLAFYFD